MDTPAFVFRPLGVTDLPLLHAWLTAPHVAAWWGSPGSLDEVRAEYEPLLRGETDVRPYLALVGGEPVGYIQSYVAMESGDGWWPEETDPGTRGIDQLLADPARLSQGLGTAMVRAFVALLFEDPSVTRVQVDPAPENARAIRAYEKAGFRRVREVNTPDGPAILMVCEAPRGSKRAR